MVLSGFVPWYNLPAREFPALRWLRQQYPFTVSPALFARPAVQPAYPSTPVRRPFPAKVWVLEQRAGD
jgi:hypothetical protein